MLRTWEVNPGGMRLVEVKAPPFVVNSRKLVKALTFPRDHLLLWKRTNLDCPWRFEATPFYHAKLGWSTECTRSLGW